MSPVVKTALFYLENTQGRQFRVFIWDQYSITTEYTMRFLKLFIVAALVSGQSFGQLPKNDQKIKVNGIEMYFEVYGEGEPLLLLHGWTQSSSFWETYIPTYAQNFKVYAVDLRGHGRTSPITDDFTIKKTAEDIAGLLDYLNLEKVKAIGLSYGGLALLQLASVHPKKIESMVLIGVSQKYNGAENQEKGDAFAYENLPKSFIDDLRKIHYHGENQVKALFDQNLDYQINLSDQEIQGIGSNTLLVQGDRDEVLGIEPAIDLHRSLPNSELWIVPNAGHLAITASNIETFLAKSTAFLSSKE